MKGSEMKGFAAVALIAAALALAPKVHAQAAAFRSRAGPGHRSEPNRTSPNRYQFVARNW
jgi:hypothetical protein